MRFLAHDVRYAVRLFSKQPATAAAMLVTLALAVGANTAVFAVVNAVLLRPLPYFDPDRLVIIWEQRPAEGNDSNWVSPADFLDWSRTSNSFSAMASYAASTADLTGTGDPLQVHVGGVTGTFFDVLGVRTAVGRTFRAGEDVFGSHRVVILSHRLWQQRFGSDASIVGKTVVVDGVPHEVTGVLRHDFEFPGEHVDLWAPLVLRAGSSAPPRASHYLHVYARLKDGVSIESAQGEMQRLGDQLSATYPQENEGHGPRVVSLREDTIAPARRGLLVVMAAVGFLLLIACTNVTNLLLARSAGRRRELAVRAAIGAGKQRLLAQSLTESMVLTGIGGLLGLVVATWTLQLLVIETPTALRGAGLERARLDLSALLFTLLTCVVTAVIAGSLPAWQIARTEPADPLREAGGRSPLSLRRGVRLLLVGGQVAFTVLLLIGAGLMARTFWRVISQPAGIDTANRLTVNVNLPRLRYADADAIRRARRALDAGFETLPGVIAVGVSNNLPLTGSDSRRGITVEGLQRTPGDNPVRAHTRIVSTGYFRAVGISVREGRTFAATDDERAPLAVVVNETMARRYWAGQSAVGKRVRFNGDGEPWRTVIGVIADVRHWGLDQEVNPELYMPHDQQPSATLTYVFHTAAEPLALVPAVAAHMRTVDRDLPLGSPRSYEDVARLATASRRWAAMLLAVFAVLGVALAGAGIYGVMSHLVELRTGEISIRLSLGARPAAMLRQVLREALINAGVGLVCGLIAGLALARVLESLLFEVPPLDLVTFTAAAGIVIAIALLAALLPAIRAMRVDPVQALRQA